MENPNNQIESVAYQNIPNDMPNQSIRWLLCLPAEKFPWMQGKGTSGTENEHLLFLRVNGQTIIWRILRTILMRACVSIIFHMRRLENYMLKNNIK